MGNGNENWFLLPPFVRFVLPLSEFPSTWNRADIIIPLPLSFSIQINNVAYRTCSLSRYLRNPLLHCQTRLLLSFESKIYKKLQLTIKYPATSSGKRVYISYNTHESFNFYLLFIKTICWYNATKFEVSQRFLKCRRNEFEFHPPPSVARAAINRRPFLSSHQYHRPLRTPLDRPSNH